MRETLKQLWTNAIAYLALMLGAGLSIAGNVADTYRTRTTAVDTLDIVMAVAWPVLVVLMVEMFVSPRWVGLPWPMQVLRWLGTIAIGGMAMRVSWVHLNDLMASRGQKQDVSILGPLAIDLLAIMATALILAGRRTVQVATDVLVAGDRPVLSEWMDKVSAPQDMDMSATQPIGPIDWDAEMADMSSKCEDADEDIVQQQANTAPLPSRVPATALEIIYRMQDRPGGEVNQALMSTHDVSSKTAYRWRRAAAGR